MRQRLPPLNALRLFEAAARLLSFKNAAEELLLTPSAVSHGIQSLEQWLGTPLFLRSARGLQLTEAGQAYHPIVRDALAALAGGSARIAARHGAGGALSISAAPTFAARWLLPRLPDFRARHPEISVVLDTAQERSELSENGVDLAIRMGRGGWQGLQADLLLRETLQPLCAPVLLPQLAGGVDLGRLPLIHVARASEDWAYWAEAAGLPPPDPARGLRFDTIHMALEAACQGLGLVIGRLPLAQQELESGRLVPAGSPAVPSNVGYWLVAAEADADDPRIAAFRDWILEQAINA